MRTVELEIPDVVLFEAQAFEDARGHLFELWSSERYAAAGIPARFVQDNVSRSVHGVIRGLHLQNPHGQGKLISVLEGEVFDVIVDVRTGSPTFGRWVGATLSGKNHRQIYAPPGCAHGFCVTSEFAICAYKCTETYHPEAELGIHYADPELGIAWPIRPGLVSAKDEAHPPLRAIEPARLPVYSAPARRDASTVTGGNR